MILWWLGNLVLLAAVVAVAVLAHRLTVPAREISGYADDILIHGVGLTGTLDPLPALRDTQRLTRSLADHAGAYVAALQAQEAARPGPDQAGEVDG